MSANQHQFGLRELIAIGIGGMIGGGIFSVLGLAVNISGHAAPLAFLVAGCIALSAGYAYVKLALTFHSDGASFTYLERAFPKRPNLAGILGWIIVVGYIGTLALYAYTFGVYAADLAGRPDASLLRGILSSLIIFLFMAINLLGVKETGLAEDFVVYLKIIIITILGIAGFFSVNTNHYFPIFNKGSVSVLSAAAITFVAYEGFQLITNAVCETKNPNTNIPRSIYLSIAVVTVVYFLLAFMSVGVLAPQQFVEHGEYALAVAVYPTLGNAGRILVDIAALLATSSAINATLFGASRMSAEIATEKMMPLAFSFKNKTDVPWIALVTITMMSMIFTFAAPLETIATFSSLTFLIVSIGVAIANIKLYKKTQSSLSVSLLGLVLMSSTSLLLIWHLIQFEFNTLLFTLIAYIIVAGLEFLVSKRRFYFLR